MTTAAVAVCMLLPRATSAQPLGGTVVGGSAGITQAGSVTNINQSSNKAIINWQGFSVTPQETVNFNQPNSASVTLNRVIGNETSVISGALNANGQVFIVNSAGVLFGKGAQVNVGGLVASTRDISNDDFMAGKYTFSGSSSGAVVNQGRIRAGQGGYVALLGKTVSNDGVISASLGTVAMAAGDKITLNFGGNSLLDVTIDRGSLNALVENKRAIRADGGQVIMTAKAADAVLSAQVNNTGIVQARTVSALKGGPVHIGKIKLLAQGGTTNLSGKLDASAPKGGDGGTIETSGNRVKIADGTVVTTKSAYGKNGTWLIDPDGLTIGANGDVSAATIQSGLANGNVTISSTDPRATGTDGNINVNDAISWSANTLTLTATNNIFVNAVMTVTGTASFTGNHGSGTNADGITPMGIYMAQGKNADGTNNGTFLGRLDFSGTGTLTLNGNVYTVIQSISDLYNITTHDANSAGNLSPYFYHSAGGHYALGSNLDATGYDTASNIANSYAASGAGYAIVPGLSGVLDGLGHTINHLTINDRPTYAGNDGLVANNFGGTIRNIGMVGTIVNGYGPAGTLVGVNEGTVVNSFAIGGTVIGNFGNNVGGLVGSNGGLIANSWASLPVTGSGYVGGLVGSNVYDTFVTPNTVGTIINSYATGDVNAFPNGASVRSAFGGLVGQNLDGVIRNSYATGNVLSPAQSNGTTIVNGSEGNSDLQWVGGLVGYNTSDSFGPVATISASYATGNVFSPGQYVGGLVGKNDGGNIDGSHASGTVTATISGLGYVGGLAGGSNPYSGLGGRITNSFATGNVVAPNSSFVGGLVGGNGGIITGSYYSTGQVQGGSNVGGLVGNNAGTVESSYSTANVTGGYIVGGLVGSNQNIISNSYSAGNVNGSTIVGGIAGYNGTGAMIINSTASGLINGITDVGGVTGFNEGNTGRGVATITGSSFTGTVSGRTNVGGIAGTNVGTITNSLSTGDVFGLINVGALVGANGGVIDASRAMGEVNGAPGSLAGSNSFTNAVNQTFFGTVTNSSYQDVKAEARAEAAAAAKAAAKAAADAAARAAAARQAAVQAAAERANTAVSTANVTATNAEISTATPPDTAVSAAGTEAVGRSPSSVINSDLKSVDDKVKTEDERERRRVAASASRNARRAGSGHAGGGLGATIRSIDLDGQRYDLQNNTTKKGAGQ